MSALIGIRFTSWLIERGCPSLIVLFFSWHVPTYLLFHTLLQGGGRTLGIEGENRGHKSQGSLLDLRLFGFGALGTFFFCFVIYN